MSLDRDDRDDLITVSHYAGSDPLLVQGAGGNTSVKTRDGLLIKASGYRLADVTTDRGALHLERAALRTVLDDPRLHEQPPLLAHEISSRRLQALAGPEQPRPSMETGFHLLFGRVVLHTHPVYLNAFTCAEGGRRAIAERLGEELPWVPYAPPGWPLYQTIGRSHDAGSTTRLVLENHGLITSGQNAEQAITATATLVAEARSALGDRADGAGERAAAAAAVVTWAARLAELYENAGSSVLVRPASLRGLVDLEAGPLPSGGPLVPDDAVYGIHLATALGRDISADDWLATARAAKPTRAILWLELGGFVLVGDSAKMVDFMEENLLANVLLHSLIASLGLRPRHLGPEDVAAVLGMGSEKYRQQVATADGAPTCAS